MENEIWKPIPEYEGVYEVSNCGNIRSSDRMVWSGKAFYKKKGQLKKQQKGNNGYLKVILYKDGTYKNYDLQRLVAKAFLSCEDNDRMHVNHINDNKHDNRLLNLELVTPRENCAKSRIVYKSKYKGVHWSKSMNKWVARIYEDGTRHYLGSYDTELRAKEAYSIALKNISEGKKPKTFTANRNKYTGVSFYKKNQKWRSRFFSNNKETHIGFFSSEYAAHLARQQYINKINNV